MLSLPACLALDAEAALPWDPQPGTLPPGWAPQAVGIQLLKCNYGSGPPLTPDFLMCVCPSWTVHPEAPTPEAQPKGQQRAQDGGTGQRKLSLERSSAWNHAGLGTMHRALQTQPVDRQRSTRR